MIEDLLKNLMGLAELKKTLGLSDEEMRFFMQGKDEFMKKIRPK